MIIPFCALVAAQILDRFKQYFWTHGNETQTAKEMCTVLILRRIVLHYHQLEHYAMYFITIISALRVLQLLEMGSRVCQYSPEGSCYAILIYDCN